VKKEVAILSGFGRLWEMNDRTKARLAREVKAWQECLDCDEGDASIARYERKLADDRRLTRENIALRADATLRGHPVDYAYIDTNNNHHTT